MNRTRLHIAALWVYLAACYATVARQRRAGAFVFQTPSHRQLQLLTWWVGGSPFADHGIMIAHGSIRSGKTVACIESFLLWSQATFEDETFILAGRTVGSLKRNVMRPLTQILRAKGWAYNWNRSENWIQIGTNTYFLFGGHNASSQDDLAGLTAAGALIEEATRLHWEFVQECFNRCSVDGAKVFMNTNPAGPHHKVKTELIDQAAEKRICLLHFTLDDNPALSEERKAFYRRMFKAGTVWYKRYIMGLWVIAEGLIYDMFEEAPPWEGGHVIDTSGLLLHLGRQRFERYIVAIDYGTANSAMTFGLYGLYKQRVDGGAAEWCAHLVREYHYSGVESGRQKTDSQYADDFEDWIGDDSPSHVYLDPSAASFKAELKCRRVRGVEDAANDVEDGIRYVASLMSQGRFSVDPSCARTVAEFYQYAWDDKAAERGQDVPVKKHDHHMDRNRYALYTHLGAPRPSYTAARVPV